MAKQLVLGKENNNYVLCWEQNGNISRVDSQMVPANAVLKAFVDVSDSIDESNKSIKHTEKVVQEAKVKSTKYSNQITLATNEFGIFSAELKNSDGVLSLGEVSADISGFSEEQVNRVDLMLKGLLEMVNVYLDHVSKTMKTNVEEGLKQSPASSDEVAA